MHEYGTTPEQLASIAVQTREHAARNPDAMYRDPITVDDVLSSKLVADPLHKLDCCVISDGGCCIILTTEERARDLPHRPVYVRGAAGGTTHHSIQGMADMTVTAAAVSGPKAFAEAGITPGDVDMFAMYDSFTYTVLVVLEDLGFAPKGRRRAVRRRRQLAARRRAADEHGRRGTLVDASRHARPVPVVRSHPATSRRGGRRAGVGCGDRGRARQRRLVVDAGHGRARNGSGMSDTHDAPDWSETPELPVAAPDPR